MKKIFMALMVVLLVAGIAFAQQYAIPSGSKTGSALIYTGAASITGIAVSTDGTNAQTVDVYDALSATGTKLIPTWTVTTSSTDRMQTIGFYPPVKAGTGIYVNVSGSGTVAYEVYYYTY
jgi:hypothetical protein